MSAVTAEEKRDLLGDVPVRLVLTGGEREKAPKVFDEHPEWCFVGIEGGLECDVSYTVEDHYGVVLHHWRMGGRWMDVDYFTSATLKLIRNAVEETLEEERNV